MFPGDGCFLNAKLGLPGVPALDIRNQCSGFIYGLSVADAWIRAGIYKRVLLVGSEVHSTGLDVTTRGRDVSVIFGDGAGAALLEATEEPGPRRALLPPARRRPLRQGALDRRARLELPPAALQPRMLEDGVDLPAHGGAEGLQARRHPDARGGARGAGAGTASRPPTSSCSSRTRPTCASAEMVQRSLALRDDQVFNNIQKYGNTTAASIPLCLDEAVEGARREARRPGGPGRLRRRVHLGRGAAALVSGPRAPAAQGTRRGPYPLRRRPTAGLRTLDPRMKVRILPPQLHRRAAGGAPRPSPTGG